PDAGVRTGRLSPLDALAGLPDPGLTQPVIPALPAAPAGPGTVPATFRAEPAPDMTGPRLGALSLAACLAVAVAALRGSHTVLSTWWENRLARQSETAPLREARLKHQIAMQQIADKGTQQQAKTNRKVPSSSEFGSKSLGHRSGGKSGGGSSLFGSSGGGRGRSQKSTTNSGSAGATRAPKTPKKPTPKSPRSGLGLGGGTRQNNSRTRKKTPKTPHSQNTPKTPKTPKGPHRASQGGGAALKKHRTTDKPASPNSSKNTPRKNRSSLGGALTRDTHKAAQRRLNKRRKNGADKPALWPGDTRTRRNSPKTRKAHKDALGKDTTSPRRDTDRKRVRKDGPDMKLGPTAWRDLRKAANRRWKRRQKRDGRTLPPLWRDMAAKTRKAADGSATSPKASTKATGDAKASGKPTAPGARSGDSRSQWWERARDYARKHGRHGDFFGGSDTAAPDPQFTADPQPGTGTAAGPSNAGAGPVPGDWTRQRYTPFQNAAQAAGDSNWTVTSEHVPDSQHERREPAGVPTGQAALPRLGTPALGPAPTPHTNRPGTSRPKEPIAMPPAPVPARQDPRILKAKKQAARAAVATVGRDMAEQHETEITLDDACDAAEELSDRAFKTHDQASKLSRRAGQLRSAWLVLAEKCADDNNLIGDLFTMAAVRFAESMELVDRMAEEMSVSSIEAAEKAETAGNEINDAYRPYNIATADGGLTTPSAPVHNEA
ncbi:hypothetical protein AB0M00_44120, partial [Streptomyces chartreusis]|uniref:hypothetical protein n=1 Tax=Streptomyces chartreusis TaxID=1969 RepID=UPI00341440B7